MEQRGPGKGQGGEMGVLLQNCPSRSSGLEGDKPQTQCCMLIPTPTQLFGALVASQT